MPKLPPRPASMGPAPETITECVSLPATVSHSDPTPVSEPEYVWEDNVIAFLDTTKGVKKVACKRLGNLVVHTTLVSDETVRLWAISHEPTSFIFMALLTQADAIRVTEVVWKHTSHILATGRNNDDMKGKCPLWIQYWRRDMNEHGAYLDPAPYQKRYPIAREHIGDGKATISFK